MTTKETLHIASEFIREANKTNSTTDKKAVLKAYPQMKELLEWVYNPYKQFYVTSDNCKKNEDICLINKDENHIFNILTNLSTRFTTGHAAIAVVNGLVEYYKGYEDVIWKIIDKDLECRIGIKTINSVYPNLIPTFEVALANKYQDFKGDLFDGSFYASHKLDGCRCITIVDENGDVSHWSREGKPFETLDVVSEAVKKLNVKNVVFDGEICSVDENGNEDFQSIMKMIRKKEFTIPNPKYLIFDWITFNDFKKGSSAITLSERYKTLNWFSNTRHIEILEQTKVTSEEQFNSLMNEAREKNWEGLILRKDAPYKAGRSNDLLKVKDMQDTELKVIDVEFGPFRIIDKETKKETTIETLSAVVVRYKDYEVRVGSGFSLEERNEFFKDPSKIKGHAITVKYFEETKDKNGKLSLRFPIYKGIRDNKE